MFKTLHLGSALRASVVATGVMTFLMYTTPLLGLPLLDIMRALGSLLPWQISPYLPGALLHAGIGSALALVYALCFATVLPGPRWVRGALYSFLPWLLAIYAMGPMLALVQPGTTVVEVSQVMHPGGVATSPGQAALSLVVARLTSLMAHLVFGATLGLLYRPKAAPREESLFISEKGEPSGALQVSMCGVSDGELGIAGRRRMRRQ